MQSALFPSLLLLLCVHCFNMCGCVCVCVCVCMLFKQRGKPTPAPPHSSARGGCHGNDEGPTQSNEDALNCCEVTLEEEKNSRSESSPRPQMRRCADQLRTHTHARTHSWSYLEKVEVACLGNSTHNALWQVSLLLFKSPLTLRTWAPLDCFRDETGPMCSLSSLGAVRSRPADAFFNNSKSSFRSQSEAPMLLTGAPRITGPLSVYPPKPPCF